MCSRGECLSHNPTLTMNTLITQQFDPTILVSLNDQEAPEALKGNTLVNADHDSLIAETEASVVDFLDTGASELFSEMSTSAITVVETDLLDPFQDVSIYSDIYEVYDNELMTNEMTDHITGQYVSSEIYDDMFVVGGQEMYDSMIHTLHYTDYMEGYKDLLDIYGGLFANGYECGKTGVTKAANLKEQEVCEHTGICEDSNRDGYVGDAPTDSDCNDSTSITGYIKDKVVDAVVDLFFGDDGDDGDGDDGTTKGDPSGCWDMPDLYEYSSLSPESYDQFADDLINSNMYTQTSQLATYIQDSFL